LKTINYQIIKIFLSCPGDLIAEKNIVKKEISKLSNVLQEICRIQLEVFSWDNTAFSDRGASGEDVILEQVGLYDVYLGLIGSKLGQPTKKDVSGTAEEYQDALDKNSIDGKPTIMFFEISRQLDSATVDIEEMRKVRAFIERVRNDGVLTKTVSISDLSDQVHIHLFHSLLKNNLLPINKDPLVAAKKEIIKELSDRLAAAQEDLYNNLIEQLKVSERLEGEDSWKNRWFPESSSSANGFIMVRPHTSKEIEVASKELDSIVSDLKGLLPAYRKKFRKYIDEAIKLFTNAIMLGGVVGIADYWLWADKTMWHYKAAPSFLANKARLYAKLPALSSQFVEARNRMSHVFMDMSDEFLMAGDLFMTVRMIAAQIPNIEKDREGSPSVKVHD